MLKRNQALEIIRNSNPINHCHIVFFTENGDRHEIEKVCLASNVHKTPRHIKNADKKFRKTTPNLALDEELSTRYDTFNIYFIDTKEIRKVNIELITQVNHQPIQL